MCDGELYRFDINHPPGCGFWMLKRNMADGKTRALVAGRDLYEGRSVRL
ncbi:MAG: hypothetical protein ACRDGB_09325 [Candidatus Limnocylindria bacterium]